MIAVTPETARRVMSVSNALLASAAHRRVMRRSLLIGLVLGFLAGGTTVAAITIAIAAVIR